MRFRATVCRQGLELCSALDRPGSVSRDSACSTLRWARDPKARLFGDGARMGAPLDSDGAEAVGVCVVGGQGAAAGEFWGTGVRFQTGESRICAWRSSEAWRQGPEKEVGTGYVFADPSPSLPGSWLEPFTWTVTTYGRKNWKAAQCGRPQR